MLFSVKNIKICHPQEPSSARAFFSCYSAMFSQPKSVMRLKRPDFDHFVGSDDESPLSQMSSDSPTADYSPEAHVSNRCGNFQ
uniref:Uncharacterized protein n=1 Tax=Arundo donax TaxID=35708 RepID=A0A0A9D001_ARUDO